MFRKNPSIGQELLDVPMGDMIRQMAFSIAEAQMALDSNSIEVAEMMGGLKAVKEELNGEEFINFKDSRVFFGKEKVQLRDAVELYNSNTDQAYRAAIDAKLGNDTEAGYDKEVVDVNKLPAVSDKTVIFTPDDQRNTEVYYRDQTNISSIKWYKYIGEVYTLLDGVPATSTAPPTPVPGRKMVKPGLGTREVMLPQRLSMLELGFSPTFYQFVDTMIRVSISIKFTREGSSSFSVDSKSESKDRSIGFSWRKGLKANKTVTTTQVNAGFSQKYSYSAEGSSILQTKLVPIPPPAILEERIQQQMEIARQEAES
ncbi:hypothetical protein RRF68_03380 [Tenacibaculum sp. HL-MS23]|uniref:hypothetical protein n=1 Tax=Tenacibaculum sp. HL-MS23 TaxID=3077734 RepID=UPI0028FC1E36|nr:hypothetical protein [Tenacibaculum sp. HL-MS23]WNW02481.1 hypothetical protein RRF68_03380 [Tenacibaculum sp. HL-MS23]